eukprot:CAMPEP_0113538894 /NCGR_PEP_ID=MMETSP0015_2-20120614/7620_1 /TAXON_ID=2838 /ORGANISM="Odontella" /LENGTH=70 /DNA_ID=CAMNT_0000438521 /DNA_START=628 /DNA_END=843 /DNA_ORIENTATION=+ /assembly_acc=CAM_ASM_000160
MLAKGNQFKNKLMLFETIHEIKAVKAREKALVVQVEAMKRRARASPPCTEGGEGGEEGNGCERGVEPKWF